MIMSTHVSTFDGNARLSHGELGKAPSFFQRLFSGIASAREAQAKRYVQAHLNGLSDLRLQELGFDAAEIVEIRKATGSAPASYWM